MHPVLQTFDHQLRTIMRAVESGAVLPVGNRHLFMPEPGKFANLIQLPNGESRYVPLLDMTMSSFFDELDNLPEASLFTVVDHSLAFLVATADPNELDDTVQDSCFPEDN